MLNPAGLIGPVNLTFPHLPAALDGLRIAHLSDLHIGRSRQRYTRLGALLSNIRIDLAFFTGDYISRKGQETAAMKVMADILSPLKSKGGIFGVFGNHDTPALHEQFKSLPVHWLVNETFEHPDLPIAITGWHAMGSHQPDATASLLSETDDKQLTQPNAKLKLLLCHYPDYLPIAADLKMDIMFAGHTHGGQIRLPNKQALVNSTDLPLHLTSGLLRHQNTLAAISRGLGEITLPLRMFCPPHLLVYTLRRGPLPGKPTEHIEMVEPW